MPRLTNRLAFLLESLIQRGPLYQLLVVAGLLGLVALLGGLLAFFLTDAFAHPGVAIWWAFLRLTDPGYLGDDEGTALRVISTVVTVLGYVLFMGSLIAILSQGLNQLMRRLESGLTPISLQHHILVLGWTNRTPSIVRELLRSEGRVQRFLSRRGARRLRIVILAEHVDVHLRQELRDVLGTPVTRSPVLFRSGSSLRIEHLERVDYTRAAAILIPGADFELGGAQATDMRVVKTLLSIARRADLEVSHLPTVVAEVFDTQKAPVARQAYRGALEILAGDAFISRLIAQNVRHRGLSHVYAELLSYARGNEVYVRHEPTLAGRAFGAVAEAFPHAIPIGIVRPEEHRFRPVLNPAADFTLHEGDRMLLVARSYEDAAPGPIPPAPAEPAEPAVHQADGPLARRILLMGWSHKVPVLLDEFASYADERFAVDMLSVVPAEEREDRLARSVQSLHGLALRHLEGDYTHPAELERLDLAQYDNIVLLSSDWLASGEDTDARTILGHVLLRGMLPDAEGPDVLVELLDPANARLFRQRPGEVIVSPVILSHMLAHAALRQELTSVFGELFGPGGAEFFFRPARDYAPLGEPTSFRHVQRRAAAGGEIALGVRLHAERARSGGIRINPGPAASFAFAEGDEIVVLTH